MRQKVETLIVPLGFGISEGHILIQEKNYGSRRFI